MINAKVGQKWIAENGEVREIIMLDPGSRMSIASVGIGGRHWHYPDGRSNCNEVSHNLSASLRKRTKSKPR